jgi:hypothetical protein
MFCLTFVVLFLLYSEQISAWNVIVLTAICPSHVTSLRRITIGLTTIHCHSSSFLRGGIKTRNKSRIHQWCIEGGNYCKCDCDQL